MKRSPQLKQPFIELLIAALVSVLAKGQVAVVPAAPVAPLAPAWPAALMASAMRPASVAPAALWDLMESAQFVVLADIEAVTDCLLWKGLTPPPVCRGETGHLVAELQIREIWKLDEAWVLSSSKFVEVSFGQGCARPEPPPWGSGDLVVAFLRGAGPVSTWWEWRPVDTGPGLLFPAETDLQGYRTVLGEALRLQSGWPFPQPAPDPWLTLAGAWLRHAGQSGPGSQGARND
ncbi:MAG TPA: hypothetical protein VFC25_13725 [Verrucomicrobiae bacterium]|nr:hypothetical protein [Verrucomicrobiae bacterium]